MISYRCPWCGDEETDWDARPGEEVEHEEPCGRESCEAEEGVLPR